MENETVQAVRDAAEGASAAGWFRVAHVLGAIVYAGGVLVTARLLGLLARAEPAVRQPAAALVRRVYLWIVAPALLVLLLAGLHTAFADPQNVGYWRQPWFHMKVTVAFLVLVVDQLLVMRPLKGLAKGTADPKAQEGMYLAAFWILAPLMFAIAVSLYVIRK